MVGNAYGKHKPDSFQQSGGRRGDVGLEEVTQTRLETLELFKAENNNKPLINKS